MAERHEVFKNLTAGIQSLVIAVGVVIGGIWTASTFVALAEAQRGVAEAQRSIAEAQKAELDLELAKQKAANAIVVNCAIEAKQLTTIGGKRWVLVTVSVSNSGTKEMKLDAGKNMRFYVSRVKEINELGIGNYESRVPLRFDYADKTIEWLMLRPGAQIENMHAVQRVDGPGLYLARFAVQARDETVGSGREFSAETYFVVN